jgi:hypothetical protein
MKWYCSLIDEHKFIISRFLLHIMANNKHGTARVVRPVNWQTGPHDHRIVHDPSTLMPGMRVSHTGHPYWENRSNRSFLKGQKQKKM